MKKLPAFTVMELVVTMLIAAILIGITFTGYTMISKLYISFSKKNNELQRVGLLNELLMKDFSSAVVISKTSDGISMEGSGQKINYQFEGNFVLRTSIATDTFSLKNTEIGMYFENQPLNEFEISNEQNRLDELKMIIDLKDESIPFEYHKLYSSDNLLERK